MKRGGGGEEIRTRKMRACKNVGGKEGNLNKRYRRSRGGDSFRSGRATKPRRKKYRTYTMPRREERRGISKGEKKSFTKKKKPLKLCPSASQSLRGVGGGGKRRWSRRRKRGIPFGRKKKKNVSIVKKKVRGFPQRNCFRRRGKGRLIRREEDTFLKCQGSLIKQDQTLGGSARKAMPAEAAPIRERELAAGIGKRTQSTPLASRGGRRGRVRFTRRGKSITPSTPQKK